MKAVPIVTHTWKWDAELCDGLGAWVHESTKAIDHADSSDRKWLSSHCFWAMRNDRKVIMQPDEN